MACFVVCCPKILPHDAWRYASAVYMLPSCVCPSVCVQELHNVSKGQPVWYRNDWTNPAIFLSWRLPSTYHTLCYKGIWVYISPNARVLPSGSPDIRKIPPRQVDRVWRVVNKTRHRRRLVDGRACWRHLYDNRWVVAVYYKRSTVIAPIRRLDVRILL